MVRLHHRLQTINAFSTFIKLPTAGFRNSETSLINNDILIFLWSSSTRILDGEAFIFIAQNCCIT